MNDIRISPMWWWLLATILAVTAFYNYLLFHGTAEIFSVFIAWNIFLLAWNTRRHQHNHYLLFIGIAYLFVGIIDLLHVYSYKGMGIFPVRGSNQATQFWIAARYLESVSLLLAPRFLRRRMPVEPVFALFTFAAVLICASILVWKNFPLCYVEGSGLTLFKVVSEYLVSFFFLAALLVLFREKRALEPLVYKLLAASLFISIAAELTFTLYQDVYGLLNQLGHFLKIFSFYLIYRAIIDTSITRPHDLLYRDLKLSERRFRSVFDTAPIAFVIWDRQYRVTDWNAAAAATFGWAADEVVGRNLYSFLIPEEERPRVEQAVESLFEKNPYDHGIYRNLTRSGRIITCEWNSTALRDWEGNITGVLSLGLDITERLAAEEALKRSTEKIKHFAYSVSHDLKNPVIALRGLTRLLHQKYHTELKGKGGAYCDLILESSDQLVSLVDEINNYIATEETQLRIEQVSVSAVCRKVSEEFADRLEHRRLVHEGMEAEPVIMADYLAVLRCLRNLVDNALKYGGETLSTITVGYREDGEHHILTVADDGVGIPEESHSRIFQPFNRDAGSKGVSGAGLGLAIIREITRRHGGDVGVEAGEQRGVVFSLSFSRFLQPENASPQKPEPPEGGSSRKA